MATAIVNVIGVVSGLMTMISFGQDNFPTPNSNKAVVRISVGLDGKGDAPPHNMGGDLPDVRLWNNYGEFLGIRADPGRIGHGSSKDITVSYKDPKNGQQAMYTLFSANDDAICVAKATITWPDGSEYGWLGDWGRACGGNWYYSGVTVSGSRHVPDCFWIDKNGDQPQTGFQVRWPSFVRDSDKAPSDDEIDRFCDTFRFKMHETHDPSVITYATNPHLIDDKRRDLEHGTSPRRAGFDAKSRMLHRSKKRAEDLQQRHNFANRLVVDDLVEHKAENLCQSETSVGPDFVNPEEGYFCAMTQGKKIYPLCCETITDNCFDMDLPGLIKGGVMTRDSPYDNVEDWRGEHVDHDILIDDNGEVISE